MSITEIASTGLLRVAALPPDDHVRNESVDWATRAVAFAALQPVSGVPAGLVDLPSRAVPPPVRPRKPTRRNPKDKGSGDYRARATGHRVQADDDDEAPSTFSSLL